MDQAEGLRSVIKAKSVAAPEQKTARVLTITSGKGGVGKSNVAVNLAVQMRRLGKRVLIFDADIGLANVEVMFGTRPEHNLSDFLFRGVPLKQIVTQGPMEIGFISGGSGIVGLQNLSEEHLRYVVGSLKELDQMADVIIVDTGAGIGNGVMDFVEASPEVLLVSTPEPSSLTDSYSLLKVLYRSPSFEANHTTVRVIANKVTSTEEGRTVYGKLSAVMKQFLQSEIQYLGLIPLDDTLERAVRSQKIVSVESPGARSSMAFRLLAENLLEGKNDSYPVRRGIVQMFLDLLPHKTTRDGA